MNRPSEEESQEAIDRFLAAPAEPGVPDIMEVIEFIRERELPPDEQARPWI